MNYIQVSSPHYSSIMLTVNTSTARETRRVYMVPDVNYPWLIYTFYLLHLRRRGDVRHSV
jgi:hypothetical protein